MFLKKLRSLSAGFWAVIGACFIVLSAGQQALVAGDSKGEPISPVPKPPSARDDRVELGRVLFNSKLLSHDGMRSCSSCHDLKTNGAEARKVSLSPTGNPLRYNAPTVFNATLNFRQHWEGEALTLQDQAARSITSSEFLDETWDGLIDKLGRDPAIADRFKKAFRRPMDRDGVLDALAAFETTLLTPDSRFDLWLRGDESALNAKEEEGYRLFKSAGCIACHQGVNVGGNLFAKAGVFQPLFKTPVKRMRVPSLRNVGVTAPYFDDGSAATLNEAVRRMGEAQLGRQLTPAQIESIVAFLRTLTGRFEGNLLRAAQ